MRGTNKYQGADEKNPKVNTANIELMAPVVTQLAARVQISHITCKTEKPVTQLATRVHPRSQIGLVAGFRPKSVTRVSREGYFCRKNVEKIKGYICISKPNSSIPNSGSESTKSGEFDRVLPPAARCCTSSPVPPVLSASPCVQPLQVAARRCSLSSLPMMKVCPALGRARR